MNAMNSKRLLRVAKVAATPPLILASGLTLGFLILDPILMKWTVWIGLTTIAVSFGWVFVDLLREFIDAIIEAWRED